MTPLRQFENVFRNGFTPLHALYGRQINFSSTCRDFPLIVVTRYRSHAVRRVELIGYSVYVAYWTPNTPLRISLLQQKRITVRKS